MKILLIAALVISSATARELLENVFADIVVVVQENHWTLIGVTLALSALSLVVSLVASRCRRKKMIKKQGSYGKVRIHKESKLRQLCRPLEVAAALRLKFGSTLKGRMLHEECGGDIEADASLRDDSVFCDKMLKKVSRSFAAVIAQLPNSVAAPLRLAVGVFYLVLRALDTVEDDMDLARFELYVTAEDRAEAARDGVSATLITKQRLLRTFHLRLRNNNGQQELRDIGEGDEATLLAGMDRVLRVFAQLPASCQKVIADITEEMGCGMADYIARDLREGTEDKSDFDQYCHLVAGTVGDGLTRLFAALGFEKEELVKERKLWDDMGLFLQCTNIIRDYLEDLCDARAFWPRSIWSKHVTNLADLRLDQLDSSVPEAERTKAKARSVACLDEMVARALELTPSCLAYLENIHSLPVLRFCAVPQVMAIATLAECVGNPQVFTGVVKVRKGKAARMVLACCEPTTVAQTRAAYRTWFAKGAASIRAYALNALADAEAFSPEKTKRQAVLRSIVASCDGILRTVSSTVTENKTMTGELTKKGNSSNPKGMLRTVSAVSAAVFAILSGYFLNKARVGAPLIAIGASRALDCIAMFGLILSVAVLLGFSGLELMIEEANAEKKKPTATPLKGSGENAAATTVTANPMSKEAFVSVFREIAQELVEELSSKYGMLPDAIDHIERMMAYTCVGGKMTRGLTVVHSAFTVAGGVLAPSELRKAAVLGWCVEYLQAAFLVADDIMDESVTRRGQPCWYRAKNVGNVAINDAFMLLSQIDVLLQKYFGKDSQGRHALLHKLMFETAYQTELGQLLDTTSSPLHGEVDISMYTKERYSKIVEYKTAYYSFYLPVALGLAFNGVPEGDAAYAEAKRICLALGEYFQVQDDFLDCYGAPEVIGKIGTDIQDSKCSWLVCEALERSTPEQRAVLKACYGKADDDAATEKVKVLYSDLGLERVYEQYEAEAYSRITGMIDAVGKAQNRPIYQTLLAKIYKRNK